MKQEEHLKLIRARCVELLEIAEKRTPGEWYVAKGGLGNKDKADTVYATNDDLNYIAACRDFLCFHAPPRNSENAAFIAACAGDAEAGWKATINVIDSILPYWEAALQSPSATNVGCFTQWSIQAQPILAAWPLSLLQHQSP